MKNRRGDFITTQTRDNYDTNTRQLRHKHETITTQTRDLKSNQMNTFN